MRDIQTDRADHSDSSRTASGGPGAGPVQMPAAVAVDRRKPRTWLKVLPELVTLVLCGFLWLPTGGFTSTIGGPGPALYPRVLIALLALSMVVRIVQQVREDRRGIAAEDADEAPLEEGAEFDASLMSGRRVAVAIALSVGYVFATLFLGWVVATFVFTIVFLVLAGKRNLLIVVPTALALSVGLAYVFVRIVYISLPTGVGPFDLATVWLFELLGIY